MANLTFEQIVILLVVAIIGTIAIRFTFTFDLNAYLESRRKGYIPKLQNACTHLIFVSDKQAGKVGFQSMFVSPPGTLQYQCEQCGLIRNLQNGEVERDAQYYLEHPDEFKKQTAKFRKLAKKAGLI